MQREFNPQMAVIAFFVAMFLLSFGAVGVSTGRVRIKNQVICRAEESEWFWLLVALYFLGCVGSIGLSLYMLGVL